MKKAVVITGASSGIGKATAAAVAEAGHDVINLDRVESSGCDRIRTLLVDLTDTRSLVEVLQKIDTDFEVIALINNAGYAKTSPIEETDNDLLYKTFDLNLRCAAQCARILVPGMKERRFGRIVNVSSRSALGRELRTAYAASKGGLISMTRVWALEFARFGITSNCVAPGPISTELFNEMNPAGSDLREKMINEIPVGRIGEPSEVASAIRFFLSDSAGFINGQTLYVCGGLSVGVAPL